MLADTLKILKEHQIRLNKRKGQNYLINHQTLLKILNYADLSENDTVLEIGPGIGTLTIPMARKAEKIITIEQDPQIATILEKRLLKLGISNVTVLMGDATKVDFPYFNKVVSNLPYQISSPITFKLLENDFDFAILMYQLEFAERMVAKPGNSNYSRLSLMLHFCADIEMLLKVPRDDFFPQPKISSALIKLTPNKKAEIDKFFKNVTRALFQHKKKKTKNALLDSFHEIVDVNKITAKDIVSKMDSVLMTKRVVKLQPDEVMEISDELKYLMNLKR